MKVVQVMTEFVKGDRVRVTYEAEVSNVRDDGRVYDVKSGAVYGMFVPTDATVELIERADHPGNDPVRTVRAGISDSPPWVKVAQDAWVQLIDRRVSCVLFQSDEWMADHISERPVIGVVPTEPAAEAQEPQLRVFRDNDGDVWHERTPDSFTIRWSDGEWSDDYANMTHEALDAEHGPLTEVRD